MTDQPIHLKGRATRVWSERMATELLAAFEDADAATGFAESAEEPGRVLVVRDGASFFCDRIDCTSLSVGLGIADGHSGAALVLRKGPDGRGNDLAVTMDPHQVLALLADLAVLAQDQARYAIFQTAEISDLAETVEAGLGQIRLSPGRVAAPPMQKAARDGFREGLQAAATAASRLAAIYPNGIPADMLAEALQAGADRI